MQIAFCPLVIEFLRVRSAQGRVLDQEASKQMLNVTRNIAIAGGVLVLGLCLLFIVRSHAPSPGNPKQLLHYGQCVAFLKRYAMQDVEAFHNSVAS